MTRDQCLADQVRGGFDLLLRADGDVKRIDSLARLEVFHDRDRDQNGVGGDLGLSQRFDPFAENPHDAELQPMDLDGFTDRLLRRSEEFPRQRFGQQANLDARGDVVRVEEPARRNFEIAHDPDIARSTRGRESAAGGRR